MFKGDTQIMKQSHPKILLIAVPSWLESEMCWEGGMAML